MELLGGVIGVGQSAFGYVLPFLFVLTIVVFFHELGHFAVARWRGVAVEVFSIGFGREIWGWTDRQGTRWKISVIPLGGYVRFLGDENAASAADSAGLERMTPTERARSFHFKKLWERAAIVAAGPIANFILAVVIFAGMFMVFGERVIAPVVGKVVENSAAAEAGFEAGDRVIRIDDANITSFAEMQRIVGISPEVSLEFLVEREGELVQLVAVPRLHEVEEFGATHRRGLLGIQANASLDQVEIVRHDPITAIAKGVGDTYFIVERTMVYLGRMIVGQEDAKQLGGPLRIAQVSGEVASISFLALINLAAVLSVSIGLINLFPIPMLDGGHLLYYAIEAVRGRPMGDRAQEFGFRIGLAVVLMLMVFATWNDLVHLQVFNAISNLFS